MTEEKINVAVYGTLRTGCGNWKYYLDNNDGVEKITDDIVSGFIMYHLGGFPAIVPSENNEKIVCEIFSVDANTFRRLDGLEGYPRLYNRKEIVTDGGISAWIYFMDSDSFSFRTHYSLIESGDWLSQ